MNRQPLDITRKDNANASTQLCGFGEVVSTSAGQIAPEGAKFRLQINGAKRSKVFDSALRAVKALRRASGVGAALAVAIFTLHGQSMTPAIRDGDRLLVETSPKFSELKPGQVVLYENWFFHTEWPTIAHRLIRQKAGGWVTKGDHNLTLDRGLCTEKRLVGVVIEVLPAEARRAPTQIATR